MYINKNYCNFDLLIFQTVDMTDISLICHEVIGDESEPELECPGIKQEPELDINDFGDIKEEPNEWVCTREHTKKEPNNEEVKFEHDLIHELKEEVYTFTKCIQIFKHTTRFTRHKQICSVCNHTFRKTHKCKGGKKRCPVCGYAFRKIHTCKICIVCGLFFKDIESKYCHERKLHSIDNRPTYECDMCGFKARGRRQILAHLNAKHRIVDVKFQCDLCKSNFIRKCELRRHLLTKKHFPLFKLRALKSPPRRTTHGIDNRVTFECDICGSKPRGRPALLVHIHRHNVLHFKFQCGCCGRKFLTKASLRQHMKSKIQLLCSICGVFCKGASGLKCHSLRLHSPKVHKCTKCPKRFSYSRDLWTHMKTSKCHVPTLKHSKVHMKTSKCRVPTLKHSKTQRPSPTCSMCGGEVANSRMMDYHIKQYHSQTKLL